jgi:hypothetical protein
MARLGDGWFVTEVVLYTYDLAGLFGDGWFVTEVVLYTYDLAGGRRMDGVHLRRFFVNDAGAFLAPSSLTG